MKLVFYDGPTEDLQKIKEEWLKLHKCKTWIVDNSQGYSASVKKFNKIEKLILFKNTTVITNSLMVLDLLEPNDEAPIYDVYFYNHRKHFVRLYDIYPNIRRQNSVMKMYRANMFTNDIERG